MRGMYDTLRYQLQEWLMEGAFATYTVGGLLEGFNSNLYTKINTMDLYTGTDSDVTELVTPVLNDRSGPVSE